MNTEKYEFIFRRLATILAVSILTLSLGAAFTGILLAFYYEPSAGGAYESLKNIATEVPNGSLIRDVHDIAGNGVIVVSLIEIVVMFLGRKFTKSWLTGWISVIFFTLNAIALAWTAMILDWSQLGYWRLSIELQTIEAIPFIGSQLRDILTGGGEIDTFIIKTDVEAGGRDANSADQITDLNQGDRIAIAGSITLNDLNFNAEGANTLILLANGDILANVLNATPATIRSSTFIASTTDSILNLG